MPSLTFTLHLWAIKIAIIIIWTFCLKIASFYNAKMPTITYFMTMKTESRARMRSFLESIVKECERKFSKIGWIIHMKRHKYKPNKWYGSGLELGLWRLHTMAVQVKRLWEFIAKGLAFGLGLSRLHTYSRLKAPILIIYCSFLWTLTKSLATQSHGLST